MVIGFSSEIKENKNTPLLCMRVLPSHGTLLGAHFSRHPGCWVWEQKFGNDLYLGTYLIDIYEYLEIALKIKL